MFWRPLLAHARLAGTFLSAGEGIVKRLVVDWNMGYWLGEARRLTECKRGRGMKIMHPEDKQYKD